LGDRYRTTRRFAYWFSFRRRDIDSDLQAASYETIWWLPGDTATDYLIVSNASDKALDASLVMSDASGRQAASSLTLPARQTVRLDLRALAGSSGLTGAQGGISVQMKHDAGSIEAAEVVYDVTTGFSAMMKTFFRDSEQEVANRTMHAPMVALTSPDPALKLPPGTELVPKVFLRNAETAPLSLTGMLLWYGGGASGSVALAPKTLPAGTTQTIDLAEWAGDKIPAKANWGTILLSYHGCSGDLVPISFTQGNSGRYSMQTPFTEGGAPLWKGSMWQVDAMHDTLLVAGNAGDKPTTTALTLVYNGGKGSYTMERLLQPGQQIWADVGMTCSPRSAQKHI